MILTKEAHPEFNIHEEMQMSRKLLDFQPQETTDGMPRLSLSEKEKLKIMITEILDDILHEHHIDHDLKTSSK
jgi:hypothetical protein